MTIDHYYDITDRIPVKLSNPVNSQAYVATGVAYDVAIGGQPFFLLNDDNNPYRRVTAQYRKNQVDMSREPGEQTLTGWWLRSQSSFHLGQGITFYEPTQDESLRFQYKYSKGCDVWTKGQVTLLPDTFTSSHYTTTGFQTNTRPFQYTRSIRWNSTDGILLHDGYDLDKIAVDGTLTHFQDYTSPTDDPVYGVCDDGVYAYWVTNDVASGKLEFNKKLLTLDDTTPPTVMFTQPGITVTNAVLEYTKERIVACINNKIYEIATSATSLPTAVYTHPDSDVVFTSITSSGAAIYVSAFSGIQSNIYKFTLTTAGAMPTLTSAITAAELPVGEKVYRINYYLGSLAIGTSLGCRIAAVSDQDGSIAYGPLIFESEQPVYDVCFRDKYLWCATNVDGSPGLTRINLGQQISSLVYAYAWDLYDPATTGRNTTACAFAGDTNQIIFTTAKTATNGSIYIQHATEKIETGIIQGGFVRYNTLENKIFKYVVPRFDTTDGGLTVYSVDQYGNEFGLGVYAQGTTVGQIGIAYPPGAQQYLGFKFEFTRSALDATLSPTFTGYQLKVLPAVPRQRLIQFPCSCFDSESDKYGNKAGYEGSAFNRIATMEAIESNGDTIVVTDFRTNETFTGIIEEIDFINRTPTDKRYSGYGGLLLITMRTIS